MILKIAFFFVEMMIRYKYINSLEKKKKKDNDNLIRKASELVIRPDIKKNSDHNK